MDKTLTRVLAQARDGHAARSSAYRWMRAKFDRLYPLLQGSRRLSWRQLAEELTANGKTGGRGKLLNEDTAAKMWGRVVRDVQAEEPWRLAAVRNAKPQGEPATRTAPAREKGRSGGRPQTQPVLRDEPPPVADSSKPDWQRRIEEVQSAYQRRT